MAVVRAANEVVLDDILAEIAAYSVLHVLYSLIYYYMVSSAV
jgi:hypothetical protein